MRIKIGKRVVTWYGEGEVVRMNVCGIKGMTQVQLDAPPPVQYNLGKNPALFWACDLNKPAEVSE